MPTLKTEEAIQESLVAVQIGTGEQLTQFLWIVLLHLRFLEPPEIEDVVGGFGFIESQFLILVAPMNELLEVIRIIDRGADADSIRQLHPKIAVVLQVGSSDAVERLVEVDG